jgi:hypothetical protein
MRLSKTTKWTISLWVGLLATNALAQVNAVENRNNALNIYEGSTFESSVYVAVQANNTGKTGNNTSTTNYLIHGWVLWAVWGIFGIIQIATTRYLKAYWKVNTWIHRVAGSLVGIATAAMIMIVGNGGGGSIGSIHGTIGDLVLITVGVSAAGGILS